MIASICLVALTFGQFGSSISESALVDGDRVHILLPPVLVAEGRLLHSAWSDDGQTLLAVTEKIQISPADYKDWIEKRKPANGRAEVSISVANMRTGKAKTLWTAPSTSSSGAYIAFFRNSDVAMVQVGSEAVETSILRVSAGTSKVEVIETLTGKPGVTSSPKGDLAAITTDSPPSVRFVGKSGSVFKRQPLSLPSGVSFTKTGIAVVDEIRAPGKHKTITPGGSEQWIDGFPDFIAFDEKFETSRVEAHHSTMSIPFVKRKFRIMYASIRSEETRIFVAFDSHWVYSGESDAGIFYVSGDMNFVRPIIQVSKAAYDALLARELRAEAMAKLNQVGKALMMFAGDNDDAFPTKEQLANGEVQGYLGDASLTEGFVYHGITALGTNPSQVEAGYMLCPGGRAVLFQDGHVVFVPDR